MLLPGRDTVDLAYRGYFSVLAQRVGRFGGLFYGRDGSPDVRSCPDGDFMTVEMGDFVGHYRLCCSVVSRLTYSQSIRSAYWFWQVL